MSSFLGRAMVGRLQQVERYHIERYKRLRSHRGAQEGKGMDGEPAVHYPGDSGRRRARAGKQKKHA